MENNSKNDEFSLLYLQRHIACELRDSKVKVTQVGSEGRVNLEIQEDALVYILDHLREKKKWSHDKELMEKEICGMKAQLNQGQADVHSSKMEKEEMNSQIKVLCKKLSDTLDDLDVKTSHSRTLKSTVQKMHEDNNLNLKKISDLESQLETMSEKMEKAHEHEAETRKVASALKKAEDLLETKCLCWQQEKISLLEEMEKSRALYVAQLDEQKHENATLVGVLRNVEQELQGHQVKWQELKTSLIQDTEDLMKTLQEKEQEWKEKESSMKAQLEDLMSKKKKKKKWYRRFF